MDLRDLHSNLQMRARRHGLVFELAPPATEDLISSTGGRLNHVLPDQVQAFYRCCNGLKVADPAVLVFPLQDLQIEPPGFMRFSLFDQRHPVCFDISHLNEADQWDILSAESGFKITLTLASFWSNKLFAWIDRRRPIWEQSVSGQ